MGTNEVMKFKSHVLGYNSDVILYSNRIEWKQMSSRNWWLAMFTLGLSLLVPRREKASEVIPLSRVSSVTTRRTSPMYTVVSVITTGNTIDFKVTHDEAKEFSDYLVQWELSRQS